MPFNPYVVEDTLPSDQLLVAEETTFLFHFHIKCILCTHYTQDADFLTSLFIGLKIP